MTSKSQLVISTALVIIIKLKNCPIFLMAPHENLGSAEGYFQFCVLF